MARKTRAEVEGGLYHVITRGNNRRQIFHSPGDYEKFLSLVAVQKVRLPFFLRFCDSSIARILRIEILPEDNHQKPSAPCWSVRLADLVVDKQIPPEYSLVSRETQVRLVVSFQ